MFELANNKTRSTGAKEKRSFLQIRRLIRDELGEQHAKWEAEERIVSSRPQGMEHPVSRIQRSTSLNAFTLLEMMVVVSIICILAAIILPGAVIAKAKARRTECLNNLRQLSAAVAIYGDEHEGEFPPRARPDKCWIVALRPNYIHARVLRCPTEAPRKDRTYIINGFNDWFEATLNPDDYQTLLDWRWPHGINESAIPVPSATITFGEQLPSAGEIHMDFSQGVGNDIEKIDQRRHETGSNFSFADGSVRFLAYWSSLSPVNLWAVTEPWRSTALRDPRD